MNKRSIIISFWDILEWVCLFSKYTIISYQNIYLKKKVVYKGSKQLKVIFEVMMKYFLKHGYWTNIVGPFTRNTHEVWHYIMCNGTKCSLFVLSIRIVCCICWGKYQNYLFPFFLTQHSSFKALIIFFFLSLLCSMS